MRDIFLIIGSPVRKNVSPAGEDPVSKCSGIIPMSDPSGTRQV
jgi:hypothetical protein